MEPTICVECKHFLNRNRSSKLATWWYGRVPPVCKAYPKPRSINYVTGKQYPQGYAYCHMCNTDGNCQRFRRKGGLT